jgi:competence protein ComEC
LLAVPMMGLLVMPSAVVALVLTPLGLEDYAFRIMGEGIGAILKVSEYFSNLDGAITSIKSASPIVLGGIVTGGLTLFLWSGRGRLIGAMILVITVFVWTKSYRPTVFISEDGRVFGLMTETGRAVSKPRGSGYAVRIWLENDGEITTQNKAAMRLRIDRGKYSAIAGISDGWRIYLYLGDDSEVAATHCTENTILVVSKLTNTAGECIVIGKKLPSPIRSNIH